MGGRGASSKSSSGMSALEAFKDNARQFNEAMREGERRRAAVIEFKDITGKVNKRYWNGAAYVDRSSALYTEATGRNAVNGVYQAEYKTQWDYREIGERVNRLEKTYKNSTAANRDVAISRSIKAQEKIINNELSLVRSGKENGDEKALLSYRRRLRQLSRKITDSK